MTSTLRSGSRRASCRHSGPDRLPAAVPDADDDRVETAQTSCPGSGCRDVSRECQTVEVTERACRRGGSVACRADPAGCGAGRLWGMHGRGLLVWVRSRRAHLLGRLNVTKSASPSEHCICDDSRAGLVRRRSGRWRWAASARRRRRLAGHGLGMTDAGKSQPFPFASWPASRRLESCARSVQERRWPVPPARKPDASDARPIKRLIRHYGGHDEKAARVIEWERAMR